MSHYNPIDFNIHAAEPEVTYQINRELNLAWRIVEETGANLFLTGRAGTGKTTFLSKLRETSAKRMVVLAPTGVAAINAKGNTLHSFFQLPFAPFIPGKGFLSKDKKHYNFSRQKRRIIAAMSLLVIDEISMVRPDILDAIDSILRRYRNPALPFGGIQLLLIGDLRQLPPVLKEDEWQLLSPYYPTPYFFNSIALKNTGFQTVELSTVYRQADSGFISLLNSIRDGKADAETLSMLNSRFIPGFNPPDSEGYIRLTTHNHNANSFNNSRMSLLNSQPWVYEAIISGDFPEFTYPVEKNLLLKEGAQVMFTKNDVGSFRRYYNGLIGKVVSLTEDTVTVMPTGGDSPIEVERVEWENTRYAINESSKDIIQETIGTFTQFPLKPAWAITIHKSQGLTFDKAIIDASLSFAPGQTYVALSRCRSLEGMVLSSPIPPQAVITDREVNSFIEQCESNTPDEHTINSLRGEYLRSLLADLFDFTTLRIAFVDFKRNVTEYIVPMYPSLDSECRDTEYLVIRDIEEVGRKFISLYASSQTDPELFNANIELKERIKRGCRYFQERLKRVAIFINGLPRNIENKAYSDRLNNTFDALWFQLQLKLLMMGALAECDFSTANYTNARAEALIDLEGGEKGNHKPAGRKSNETGKVKPQRFEKSKGKKEQKPKGYSIHETIRLFRDGKSIGEIASERGLKESTISGHLADAVNQGLLPVEEVVPLPLLKEIKKALMKREGKTFDEVRDEIQRLHPEIPIPICLLLFSNKVRTGSIKQNPET